MLILVFLCWSFKWRSWCFLDYHPPIEKSEKGWDHQPPLDPLYEDLSESATPKMRTALSISQTEASESNVEMETNAAYGHSESNIEMGINAANGHVVTS